MAIIAEVVHAHVADEFLFDRDRVVIDVPAMKFIARLHGTGWYGRQTDVFEMLRPRWAYHESSAPQRIVDGAGKPIPRSLPRRGERVEKNRRKEWG